MRRVIGAFLLIAAILVLEKTCVAQELPEPAKKPAKKNVTIEGCVGAWVSLGSVILLVWMESGSHGKWVQIYYSATASQPILPESFFYRMLKYGQHYVDKGAEYYERRNRQQQIEFLRKKAAQLGLQLAPTLT